MQRRQEFPIAALLNPKSLINPTFFKYYGRHVVNQVTNTSAFSPSSIVANDCKAADYVANQVALSFPTVLLSAWRRGLYGEFVETCRGRLLRGCTVAENDARYSEGGNGAKGSIGECG